MTWMEDAKADIKSDEGCRLTPYEDGVGVWTDGYGNTHGVVPGHAITQEKADADFETNFATACADLDEHLAWWKIAPDAVRRGMVSMCFNLGYPRLSGFSHMLACGEMGNYPGMADAALDSKWADQVKGRAMRIVDLFRSASDGAGV